MDTNSAGKALITLLQSADLSDLAEQVEQTLREATWVQIGVVGEFSAGKSSLLNALIGRRCLPESTEPTTGRITLIESVHDRTEPAFYAQEGDTRRPVSVLEFADLVLGARGEALPVLLVPATTSIPAGIRFIDTPGLGSLRQLDAETTLGFAAYLDAMLVCVDINRGGLSASLKDFLGMPLLVPLRRDAVVVLCKADQKNPEGRSAVLAGLLTALREMMTDAEWARRSEDERIVATSAHDALAGTDQGVERLRRVLASGLYTQRRRLADERRLKTMRAVCKRAITTLDQRADNLTVDDTEFRERIRTHRAAIDALQAQRERAEEAFHELGTRLASQLQKVARSYGTRMASSDKATRDGAAAALRDELSSAARDGVRTYLGDVGALPATAELSDLVQEIERIYSVRDMAVTVSTALIVAALSGGTSLGANAAEAGAGGVGRAAAAKAASSAATKNVFGRFLAAAGQVVRDINPLEFIGDQLAQSRATDAAISELDRVARGVTSSVMQHLRQSYLTKVLSEAQELLSRRTRELEATERERSSAAEAVIEHQRDLRIATRNLRAWDKEHADEHAA